MKKKLTLSGVVFLLLIIAVTYVYNKKNSSDEENSNDWGAYTGSYTKIVYEIGSEHNTHAGGQNDVDYDYYNTLTLEGTLTQGELIVTFSEFDPDSLEIGSVFRTETITESGCYVYDLNYLPEGSYWIEINPGNDQTEAEFSYKTENIRKE